MKNRELKFRIWSLQEQPEWEVPKVKTFITNTYEVYNPRLNDIFKDKRVVFQQYTGLKDKNGKEIYEGDIVIYTINKKTYMSVVMWENFGWVTRDYPEGSTIPLTTGIEYTIIGNIFENSHVLK